jgi:alkylhydroperoxidase family enzyme
VSDDLYAEAREHFSEKELVDLVLQITVINSYNRIAMTFQATPPKIKRP